MTDAFAVWVADAWHIPDESLLPMFADMGGDEEFLEKWPRTGQMRGRDAVARASAHEPPSRSVRLWPTPAASLPNDGEEPAQWLRRFVRNATKKTGATRAGVPLAVAARAPVVLSIAKINRVPQALEVLRQHEASPDPGLASTEMLNPAWVEHLMGFPEGWTEI